MQQTIEMTTLKMAAAGICLLALAACGGNTGSLAEQSASADASANGNPAIKSANHGTDIASTANPGGLYVPDDALSVSEIYGADLVFSNYKEKYVVEINDDDGVASVAFTLQDLDGKTIKVLPHQHKSIGYVATFDPVDVTPGSYQIAVQATGVDGGDGDFSGSKQVTYNIDVKAAATTNVMERF